VNAIFGTTRPTRVSVGISSPSKNHSDTDLGESSRGTSTGTSTGGLGSLDVTPPSTIDETAHVIDISTLPTEKDTDQIMRIYGAQQTNMIIDARPSVNAMANHALGYGSENMEGYPNAKKLFLGIDNIHVMRKSVEDLVDAVKDSDLTTLPPLYTSLERSKWRKHIGLLLSGARIISNTIAIQHSHVLIHCSDGWDRTSQLSALAQLCLDPYYRTLKGFMILVEKDWVSFGHMFRLRSGLLGHEKWFEVENERVNTGRVVSNGASEVADVQGNPFENAIAKAQGFFRRKAEADDDADTQSFESSPSRVSSHNKKNEKYATRPKEVSPIFHQFLDACYQLLRQFPTRFEFNERFLRRLFYHLYSCQYGNFLFNSEMERVHSHAKSETSSVWSYFLSHREKFVNENYDAVIDENDKARTSLISPLQEDVKWWHELFGRTEQEMNGPTPTTTNPTVSEEDIGESSSAFGAADALYSLDTAAQDGSSAESSHFGAATSVPSSVGKGSDGTTNRFARMEDRASDLSSTTFGELSLESMQVDKADEKPVSGWLPGGFGAKKRDPLMGVELD
jgi:myotubularin-related protein 6/7/8